MPLNAYVAFFKDNYVVPAGKPNASDGQQDIANMEIPGTHDTAPYLNWIRANSFDQLIRQNNHGAFSFVKDIDATSPDIAFYASAARKINMLKFVIAYTTAGSNDNNPKVVYRFGGVKIITLRPHNMELDSATTQAYATEREYVSISYGTVSWDAFAEDGTHLRSASWSISANSGDEPSDPSAAATTSP